MRIVYTLTQYGFGRQNIHPVSNIISVEAVAAYARSLAITFSKDLAFAGLKGTNCRCGRSAMTLSIHVRFHISNATANQH
jgi:hypothetical protein